MSRGGVTGSAPTVVYDGDCGFCTRTARWLAAHSEVEIVAWQALDLDAVGLTRQQVSEEVQWIEDGRLVDHGSGAVARSLRACGGAPGVAGWLMLRPGLRVLAALGYATVARNRHRLPGGTPACRLD